MRLMSKTFAVDSVRNSLENVKVQTYFVFITKRGSVMINQCKAGETGSSSYTFKLSQLDYLKKWMRALEF